MTGRDTIAELVPDRRFAYTHVSNLPIKNYRAEVDLTPAGEGTAIRWVSAFDPKVPGTGGLLRRGPGRLRVQARPRPRGRTPTSRAPVTS